MMFWEWTALQILEDGDKLLRIGQEVTNKILFQNQNPSLSAYMCKSHMDST